VVVDLGLAVGGDVGDDDKLVDAVDDPVEVDNEVRVDGLVCEEEVGEDEALELEAVDSDVVNGEVVKDDELTDDNEDDEMIVIKADELDD
jgi:hypothetical protein